MTACLMPTWGDLVAVLFWLAMFVLLGWMVWTGRHGLIDRPEEPSPIKSPRSHVRRIR